jgi:hypothetical protein
VHAGNGKATQRDFKGWLEGPAAPWLCTCIHLAISTHHQLPVTAKHVVAVGADAQSTVDWHNNHRAGWAGSGLHLQPYNHLSHCCLTDTCTWEAEEAGMEGIVSSNHSSFVSQTD